MNSVSDFFARSQTAFFRFFADTFFAKRYGHRAVVLETIAGVPGMVAGMWIHLKSLRSMKTGYGPLIRELLAEAENERMHLMFFIEIAKPSRLERTLILIAQLVFWNYYFLLYVVAPKTAHKMIHYFEEEAVRSYTSYLTLIEDGEVELHITQLSTLQQVLHSSVTELLLLRRSARVETSTKWTGPSRVIYIVRARRASETARRATERRAPRRRPRASARRPPRGYP